jgi:hypothetical protein
VFNETSLNIINGSTFSERFIRPRYDSYSFANLPATIAWLLTGQGAPALPLDVFGELPTRCEQVILVFIDAFGWRFFERYAERYPLLQAAITEGVVSKLTSQFPSTTAAHVTSIHTGLNVGQSGIYEWHYYEPLLDDIISPLLFSYARDGLTRETLRQAAISPAALFPQRTLYHALQEQGVAAHLFLRQTYAASTYSHSVCAGAAMHPYEKIGEACAALVELVTARATVPTYYFLYFDRIDGVGHVSGPSSPQFDEAVDKFLTTLDQGLYQQARGKAGKTLLLLTADHGQVDVDPRRTFYLNLQMPEITRLLKTNAQGIPLVPAGSPRDMFLYVKEDAVDACLALLQQRLAGTAEVYRTEKLLAQGFFGPQEPSPALLARLGNVVILPYAQETVWWFEEGRYTMPYFGHHGGLTPEEMEIPLMTLPL